MNFTATRSPKKSRSVYFIIVLLVCYIVTATKLVSERYAVQGTTPGWWSVTDVTSIVFIVLALVSVVQTFDSRFASEITIGRMLVASLEAVAIATASFFISGIQHEEPYLGFLFLVALLLHIVTMVLLRWRRMGVGAALLCTIGATLFIVVGTVIYQMNYTPLTVKDVAEKCYDAEVVLGAAVHEKSEPSETLRARIEKAYELLAVRAADHVVTTGSNARGELAEAVVEKRELESMGIDSAIIVVEAHSRSTLEQVLFIRDSLVHGRAWKKFLIVSDQYHLPRALAIARFHGIDAAGVASKTPLSLEAHVIARLRDALALLQYWFFGT